MADQQSSQERTEQPTEKRKLDSKKKGQVPRSRELNTMLSLLFGGLGLVVLGDTIAKDFIALFESTLRFDRALAFDKEVMAVRFVSTAVSAVIVLSPLFALMVVGALIGPLMVGGWSFNVASMAFKLEKISPAKGIKRVISAKGAMELIKALLKFLFLSATALLLFNFLLEDILLLGRKPPEQAFIEAVSMLQWSLVLLSLAMIFIVVFDVPFELWNHNQQLKMTRQEIKDEMKESEGRPEVKGRIRNLQREISQRRMMEAVPTADVVITNPTHFAVALKYESVDGGAPTVLAKGRDLIALKIRSLAEENDVAIFSAPPLARALYSSAEIGEEIPQNLYLAVAKVLAYIYQVRIAGGEQFATRPDDIEIPEEYRDLYKKENLDGDG
ncbi:MAG: flagellar biosynthesis protein FlhB [Halioglobus sp.]